MMKNSIIEWSCCALSALLTATQTEHVFQIIQLVLTCIGAAVAIAFTIFKWYKAAKADGKITMDELMQLGDQLVEHEDEIKQIIESVKEESDKNQKE